MTPADKVLFGDLGLDALTYMKRVVYALDLAQQVPVAAAFAAGAPFELRVRMWSNREPRFSVVQIVDGQEIELHTAGGSTR